jgi:hypothetical protein
VAPPARLVSFLGAVGAARPSRLSAHDSGCCLEAREWLLLVNASRCRLSNTTAPGWLRDRYDWGPSRWPLHWCEAVRSKELDCGALADMAEECLRGEGLTTARAQVIKSFSPTDVDHWTRRWREAGGATWWIGEGIIYHEDVAIVGQELRLFDPTNSAWVHESALRGYGRIIAIRFIPAITGVDGSWGAYADGDWHITDAALHGRTERAS